jgi:hypothetical protein
MTGYPQTEFDDSADANFKELYKTSSPNTVCKVVKQ